MEVGILSQMKELSYDDLVLLIKMLKPYKNSLTLMLDLFKTPDDMIKFLDLFAGQEFRVPSRSRIYFVLLNIQVYNYYTAHLSDKNVLKNTANKFNMTIQRVQTIIERVNSKK